MKKLLLLCLVAGSANAGLRLDDGPVMAGDHLVWRNQNGWDIVLTHEKPDWCKGLGMMYSISPKGDANYGCWRTLNNRVHIEYQNGLLRNFVFDLINFRSKSE
jgi:hypothetical protein